MLVFALGAVIGFVTSVPLMGPVSVLVFRAGLARRYRAGFAASAGAAIAEALYAAAAVFGLEWVLRAWPDATAALRVVAAALLLGLGGWFLYVDPVPDPDAETPKHLARRRSAFLAGFVVSGINPTLLASWSAGAALIVSVTGIQLGGWHRLTFPLGVAVGIMAWFALLLHLLHRYGDQLKDSIITWIVRCMAAALLGLGGWQVVILLTGKPW